MELTDRYTDLLHRVAVTDGDGAIVHRVIVDGDAERGSDGILTAVALADRVLLIVLVSKVILGSRP